MFKKDNKNYATELKVFDNDKETIDNLSGLANYVEKDYLDKDGYVKVESREECLDRFYSEALKLQEQGIYEDVIKGENCVFVDLEGPFDFIYTIDMSGFAGGEGTGTNYLKHEDWKSIVQKNNLNIKPFE